MKFHFSDKHINISTTRYTLFCPNTNEHKAYVPQIAFTFFLALRPWFHVKMKLF